VVGVNGRSQGSDCGRIWVLAVQIQGEFFSSALVATMVVVAACAPKDVDLDFFTFPGSALFSFWGSSGGGASWVVGEPGRVEEKLALPSGAWVGVSFGFSGRGGRAPAAWCAGRVHSPPTPIWATEVGCPAPPLFGRLQGCFECFFWLLRGF
jgi:hypothetical protein